MEGKYVIYFCAFPTTTKRPFPRKMRVNQWFCWQNLNCRWSGGGNCEWKLRVETESIGRCELYCKYDQTYAVDSGKPDISEFLSDSYFMVIEWRGILMNLIDLTFVSSHNNWLVDWSIFVAFSVLKVLYRFNAVFFKSLFSKELANIIAVSWLNKHVAKTLFLQEQWNLFCWTLSTGVKVRKVQNEWSQKVEIEFNTSEKITLTHRLFNDTGW